jgi:hypothetical protein
MRRFPAAALLLLALIVCAAPTLAGGNANFLIGARSVGDEDFWGDNQDQGVAGVMVDFGKEGWPIHIALANMDSGSESGDVTGSVSEYALGVMKVWEPQGKIVRPYVGGGVAAVTMSFSVDTGGGDFILHDTTSAFYVDGGVFWRTGKRFNIGLGARLMTQARGEIQGVRGDADYVQFHALAGFGWPRREKP